MNGAFNTDYYGRNPWGSIGANNTSFGIPKVTGLDGAKAYPMGANQSIALFDANDNLFWLKTTDSAGFASYRAFRYTEEEMGEPQVMVSRNEFNELKDMVQKLLDNAGGE